MASSDNLRDVAGPLLAAAGLELWDVEVTRDVVRILVDRSGGVDLDALSAATGVLSPVLDERSDLAPAGRYQLEVSSPGIERTLRTPDQYRRYVGSPVTVKTTVAIDGARRFHGLLTSADEVGFTLVPEDAPGDTTCALRYDQVDRTRTVLVWGPGPRPHRQPRPAASRVPATGTRRGRPNQKDIVS
ncbi:MAG: ribosome maturation factor RimP [Acidimicrobiales bacterium]